MIFPLGLGHRILKVPIVTLLLVVANFYFYFQFQSQVDMKNELGRAYRDSKYVEEYINGFIDYCYKVAGDKIPCEEYGQSEIRDTYDKAINDKNDPKSASKISAENIIKLTNILVKYHNIVTKNPQDLNIKNLSQLMDAQVRKLEILEDIYYQYGFLSRNNFTPITVAKAQFNHFDLVHLIGNMLFLLVFGVYVEHRVSRIPFLFFYLLGGTMGLLLQISMFSPEHYLLGASANVYAVMGMFYMLFYDKKMKFFIWYLASRRITVDVKYWLPALVFANEIVTTMRDTSTFGDGVAHLAHVGGLITGMVCGYFLREFSPLHQNFLYQFEVDEWRAAKKSGNSVQISETALRILSFNPFNDLVIEDFMNSLIEGYSKRPIATEHMKITKLFPVYFKFCINNKKFDELILALNRIQPHSNLEPLLRYRNLNDLVTMGDLCVQKNEYLLSVTFYIAFIHSYPNSKLALNIQQTIKNILEHLDPNEYNISVLKTLTSNTHNVFLKKLLFDYLQQRNTQISEAA